MRWCDPSCLQISACTLLLAQTPRYPPPFPLLPHHPTPTYQCDTYIPLPHMLPLMFQRMVNLVVLRPKLMAFYALESADEFFILPALLFCGWAIGSLHASSMMDRVGRKYMLFVSLALASLSST